VNYYDFKESAELSAEVVEKIFNRERTMLWYFSRDGFTEETEVYMKGKRYVICKYSLNFVESYL